MTNLRVGQFVRSLANDLGLGKVASVDGESVIVEYFDGPTAGEQPTRKLPAELVEPAELRQERRVYFRHPATHVWFVGRSLIKTGDSYRVQFPNRKVGELPESALFVRWDRPLEDPTEHLAHRVNETPYFHEGRAPFRQSLVAQQAGCASMTGLFSSVVELEEHQIEVVRRALGDPIRRHLLADDSGLGKTIEAGAIMRQYALEKPWEFGILVVVPRPLCAQWEEELARRFLFEQELDERVFVVPHGEVAELEERAKTVGMVVIDDAHEVARAAHAQELEERELFEVYRRLTGSVDRLLLLSSMPAVEEEATYRAMLHLLDPEKYELDAQEPPGPSQRVLRTRRTEEIDWLFPGRSEKSVIDVDVAGQADIENALESWREGASAQAAEDGHTSQWTGLYRRFVEVVCGPSLALSQVIDDRLSDIENSAGLATFDGEKGALEKLKEVAVTAQKQGARQKALLEELRSLEEGERAIIFAGDEVSADVIWEFLDNSLDIGVVRHDLARHFQETSWRQFFDDPSTPVLICDRRAERGFNFQKSQAKLIHLDMPTSPRRIDDRIGRLDRYGTGKSVRSIFLRPTSGRLFEVLSTLYDEGCGIFGRSIGPVRWSVDRKVDQIWEQAFGQGIDLVEEAVDELGGESGWVEQRLEQVGEERKAQSLAPPSEEGAAGEFYDRLWDVDFDADGLEQAAHEWIGNRLQFHRVTGDHQRVLRYEYRTESTAKHPTLVPIAELLGRFSPAVDPGVNGFFSYPMSFHRGTANSLQTRVARLGEPFITAMEEYVRCDDRGMCYAMWRHVPREELVDDPGVYFRFDFIVDADVEQARRLLSERDGAVDEAARIRADYFFPPRLHTIWVRGDSGPVRDAHLLELLELPYDSDGANRYGRDYNLNPTRWEVIEEFYDQKSWEKSCLDARSEAQELLAASDKLQQECARCAELVVQSYLFDDDPGSQLMAAIQKGITNPRLKLDAMGAVFLSTVSPFEE